MTAEKHRKLNWLQHHLPEGLLADARWLEARGYSSSLRHQYVARGWLEQPAHGVYRRPTGKLAAGQDEAKLRWEQVVISLQILLKTPIIVGGRTALELQGFTHYLAPVGSREIHLYGHEKLPGWVLKLDLEARFILHAKKLFGNDSINPGIDHSLTQQAWGPWNWPLTLSTPERAILELLDQVPQRETFHQADVLIEGLRTLSPRRVHKLLADCRSIKVKRLFLWFAERHNPDWLKHLDRGSIDLGSGKRMLVRGGKLDPIYLISVPENIDAGG
jgi:hypothetical protein